MEKSLKNLLFTNQSNKQILAKNTFWLGAIEVGSKLILLFTTLTIVRYLGPKEFGAYNFSLSFAAIISVLSDLGINTILTRDVAKNKQLAEILLANALGMRLIGSIVVVILTFLGYFFLGKNQPYFFLVLLAVLYTLAMMIQGVILAVLVAFEKMEYIFAIRMGYYIGILASTIMVVGMKLKSVNILFSYTVVALLTAIIAIYWLKKLGVRTRIAFKLTEWQQLWTELWPMFGFITAGTIYTNLDTMLISNFFGNEQVGIYQAGYKILYAFQSVNIINSATFPRFSILIQENRKEQLNRLLKLLVIGSGGILVTMAIAITWQRDFIIQLIYGKVYNSSATITAILIWGGVLNYFRIMSTNLLVAKGKQRLMFRIMIAGLLTNAILNFMVMPRVGFEFSATSLVLSEAVILIMSVILYRRSA